MIKKVHLEFTIGDFNQLDQIKKMRQIVFVGKSNVGKSSLINTLMNRKNLAHTSNSPGKTQTINFYNIEEEFYFVDLPGYGYACASKEKIFDWGKLIEKYLTQNKFIDLIFLLIDIRHTPGENDKLMCDWLKFYKFDLIVIATKLDKIKTSQTEKNIQTIREKLDLEKEIILPFSSKTKFNRDKILDLIKQKRSSEK